MTIEDRERRLRVSLYQAATKVGFRDENDAIRVVVNDEALRGQLVLDAEGNATNALDLLSAFVARHPTWTHGADMNSVLRRGMARGPSVPIDPSLLGADRQRPTGSADGGARGTPFQPTEHPINAALRRAR